MAKIFHITLITVVLIILSVPFLSMVSGLQPTVQLMENRRLQTLPGIGKVSLSAIVDYPKKFGFWFDDNYGFRKYLSHKYLLLLINGLKVPVVKEIIIGKGNWLFWGGDHILDRYRTTRKLSEGELETLKNIHEKQARYCEERGIRYLFVTPPNKFSVYPEYLPNFLTRPTKDTTHSDQLVSFLKDQSGISVLSLKPTLLEAKKREKIYFEADTHWNNMGAFFGYLEIMKTITTWFPEITPFSLNDFRITRSIKKDAELAKILGLSGHLNETYKTFVPKIPYTWNRKNDRDRFYTENDLLFPKTMCVVNQKGGSGRKAVMFIDSFSFAMAEMFNQHFSRIVYVYKVLGYNNFDTRIIDHEKPDLVVCEIGERFFLKIP